MAAGRRTAAAGGGSSGSNEEGGAGEVKKRGNGGGAAAVPATPETRMVSREREGRGDVGKGEEDIWERGLVAGFLSCSQGGMEEGGWPPRASRPLS